MTIQIALSPNELDLVRDALRYAAHSAVPESMPVLLEIAMEASGPSMELDMDEARALQMVLVAYLTKTDGAFPTPGEKMLLKGMHTRLTQALTEAKSRLDCGLSKK